jgi:anti-sigma B factor antagonist
MAITERVVDDVTVFAIEGVLGVGGEEGLHELVQQGVKDGRRSFIVDLSRARHVDSTGIAMLIGAYCSITRSGGRLVLSGINPHVARVLQITRLINVFEHVDDEAAAMRSLSVPPETRVSPPPPVIS